MKGFFLLSLLLAVAIAAPVEDLITDLPGLNFPVNYTQYSGYLQASETRFLHYWFFSSQNDPVNDPVLLWMNGGPGCASLLGLFTELGPFYVDQDGSGELHPNPWSWNTFSNIFFLEGPVCVGFSYSDDDCVSTDDSTAADNYAAVQDFFVKFPEYQTNEFYVTGESYCGIYIPTLTELIVDGMDSSPVTFNYQGFAIGNGYFDVELNDNSLVFFGYYHGVIGDDLWTKIVGDCCVGPANRHNCDFFSTNGRCQFYVNEAFIRFYANGLNPYNLYAQCRLTESNSRANVELKHIGKRFLSSPARPQVLLSTDTYDPACSDNTPEIDYLNRADVKAAIHIPAQAPFWEPCSNIPYTQTYSSTMDKIAYVASKSRALIFNGDVDMVCNFLGNLWDIEDLGLTVIENRRNWKSDGQIAGYVKRFENLDFLTVKGSGHMVPGYEPAAALKMIKAFVFQTDY